VTLIVASLWFAVTVNVAHEAHMRASVNNRHYAALLEYARLDLEIRAVAVRRWAARTGELPSSLSECDVGASELAEVVMADPKLRAWAELGKGPVEEPWWRQSVSRGQETGEAPPAPPSSLDFLGLPILYRISLESAPDESWLHSSDPLCSATVSYAVRSGGVPPEPPRPFALGSMFLADRMEEQRPLDRQASMAWTLCHAGSGALILLGLVVTVCWRGRPVGRNGRSGVVVSCIIAGCVAMVGLTSRVTCYKVRSFQSSSLSRSDRLELLEKAVERREVPDDVADLARRLLESSTWSRRE